MNWFPLPRGLMENPIFTMCTPAEKLFLLHVASEVNLRGPFYRADLEEAVILGLSEDKVRRARRAFMSMGWITAERGFQAGGRNLATRYSAVLGAARTDGDFFAPLHRYTFEALLHYIRSKRLTHADLVTYVYLTYFKARCGREDDWFFITKNELRELTSLPSASLSVDHLHRAFPEGSHLFEVHDEYHRLVFSKWAIFADPSENENNAKNAERYREEIAEALKARKHPVPKRSATTRRATSASRR